jgi:ParB family chromosome partitioning protein
MLLEGTIVAETVQLIPIDQIERNPENPRLIFRQDELDSLQASIAKQGILVPLTLYKDKSHYYLLDGERRWRCAGKLNLGKVPAIVQPKPDTMQNLMMMFAIHNARKDWDPLPTAFKLEELEDIFEKRNGRKPTESELAGIASLSRGEVRRLKKLLSLPHEYRQELLDELEKPRSQQEITVDHVLEATKAAESLRKKEVISPPEEDKLRAAIVQKFRQKIEKNTVAPRLLVKLANAVSRGEVTSQTARLAVNKIVHKRNYTIQNAFADTVEQADFEHTTEQLIQRVIARLQEHQTRKYQMSAGLRNYLRDLQTLIGKSLR